MVDRQLTDFCGNQRGNHAGMTYDPFWPHRLHLMAKNCIFAVRVRPRDRPEKIRSNPRWPVSLIKRRPHGSFAMCYNFNR